MDTPRVMIFASGDATGGGSGARKLLENVVSGKLWMDTIALVSNHENGGARRVADDFKIPFELMQRFEIEDYQALVEKYRPDFILLSGWLKLTKGLDKTRTINIHPGPPKPFGGKGMHGMHVHRAVIEAFQRGEITYTAVSMFFVTEAFDEGPEIFHLPIRIDDDETAEALYQNKIRIVEHQWQWWVTDLVIHGQITWDGSNKPIVPHWYRSKIFCPDYLKC